MPQQPRLMPNLRVVFGGVLGLLQQFRRFRVPMIGKRPHEAEIARRKQPERGAADVLLFRGIENELFEFGEIRGIEREVIRFFEMARKLGLFVIQQRPNQQAFDQRGLRRKRIDPAQRLERQAVAAPSRRDCPEHRFFMRRRGQRIAR